MSGSGGVRRAGCLLTPGTGQVVVAGLVDKGLGGQRQKNAVLVDSHSTQRTSVSGVQRERAHWMQD